MSLVRYGQTWRRLRDGQTYTVEAVWHNVRQVLLKRTDNGRTHKVFITSLQDRYEPTTGPLPGDYSNGQRSTPPAEGSAGLMVEGHHPTPGSTP